MNKVQWGILKKKNQTGSLDSKTNIFFFPSYLRIYFFLNTGGEHLINSKEKRQTANHL